MTRVLVIGLGYFSQYHLAAWSTLTGVKLVGAVDPDPARRAWAAARFEVVTHIEMIEAADADIVDIVAPPSAHSELIRALLGQTRAIICQKPFCRSYDEAAQVVEAAEVAGTPLIVHENFRFQPWYRTTKAFLDNGELGSVYRARFALRPGDGRGPDAYLGRQPAFQKMERFLVRETAVHFIDVFRWLLGPITHVYADLRRLNPAIAGEDASYLIFDHQSGAQSLFDGNRLSDHSTDNPRRTMGEMEIEGEGGTLRLDGSGHLSFREFGGHSWRSVPVMGGTDAESFGGGCVKALCAHVVDALDGQGAFENTARDYLAVLAVEHAAYKSSKTGTKQKIG